MYPWLHSLDTLRAHATHDDANVRRWAVSTWIALYPDGDLVGLARMLLDPDPEVRHDVAQHLASTRDQRWTPVLLKALELAEEGDKRTFVEALGVLADPRAVPALSSLLRRVRSGRDLVALVDALSAHRVEGSWRALAPLLELLSADDVFSANLVGRILALGRRADVADLVARWRTWDDRTPSPVAGAIAEWLGAEADLVRAAARLPDWGVRQVLHRLSRLDPRVRPPAEVVDVLERAEATGPTALLRALHGALVGLITQRRDRVDAWVHEVLGPPAEDYRALVVGAEALLAALAAVPPAPGREEVETALALAAWLSVLVGVDAQRELKGARDRHLTARELFLAPRSVVSPATTAALASKPDKAVSWLAELLTTDAPDLVKIRAARLLADLGKGRPERLTPWLDRLTELPGQRLDPALFDAVVQVLRVAGPVAAESLAAHLDEEASDEVIEALGKLPCEVSFQALAHAWTTAVRLDLRVAEALTDLGDPRAVEVLAPGWMPGLVPLAAMLDALCTLHDLAPPQRAAWRAELELIDGARAFSGLQPPAEG
jgi:hypothetical protein